MKSSVLAIAGAAVALFITAGIVAAQSPSPSPSLSVSPTPTPRVAPQGAPSTGMGGVFR